MSHIKRYDKNYVNLGSSARPGRKYWLSGGEVPMLGKHLRQICLSTSLSNWNM